MPHRLATRHVQVEDIESYKVLYRVPHIGEQNQGSAFLSAYRLMMPAFSWLSSATHRLNVLYSPYVSDPPPRPNGHYHQSLSYDIPAGSNDCLDRRLKVLAEALALGLLSPVRGGPLWTHMLYLPPGESMDLPDLPRSALRN